MTERFEVPETTAAAGLNRPRVAIIVAMAENRVIGRNNQLPWHLPNDLKYFKAISMGKPIVMGRKTYESIGRPLPGRANIVVTTNPYWQAEGVRIASSPDQALALASDIALVDGADEVMVIGGAQLYADLILRADRLYLTEVHAEVEGDAWFPVVDLNRWRVISRKNFAAEGPNPYGYSFVVYQRNSP